MHKILIRIFFLMIIIQNISLLYSIERIPKPDFESEYNLPEVQRPDEKNIILDYIDVVILIASISIASYFVIKRRSRNLIFVMMIFSIIYFGFYRKGCICSIGAIQNIAYGIFNSQYAIPVTAVLFFFIPMVFTLFFGRTFCSSVCPFGALQDFILVKNIKLSIYVREILSVIPFMYLGLAVLFASLQTEFIICRFDPFVNIFRLNGNLNMIVFGIIVLLISIFISRPYCRFLCPYGLLLNFISRFSKYHVKLSNKDCISCGLCKDSCPEEYILNPGVKDLSGDKGNIKKLKYLFLFLPIIIALFGLTGKYSSTYFSMFDKKVNLALQIRNEESNNDKVGNKSKLDTFELKAFKASNMDKAVLFEEALIIRNKYLFGSIILGCFIGLVISIKLVKILIKKKIDYYKIDRGPCFSCGRCLSYCSLMRVKKSMNITKTDINENSVI